MMYRPISSSARNRYSGRRPSFFRPVVEQLEDRRLPSAMLNLVMSGPPTAFPGTKVTYMVMLSSTGPNAAQGVSLTDVLPSGTTLVSQNQTSGPTFTLAQSGGTVTDSIATMAAGTSAAFNIVAAIPSTTPVNTLLVNQASVSATSALSNSSVTRASASTTVVPPPSPSLGWVIDADPNIADTSNWGLALDGQNNSLITGYFTGTTTFGTTSSGATINLTSAGGMDGDLAKYDSNGTLLWAKNFGGAGDDNATRVATDASGNIYLAGFFSGTASFGTITLTSAGTTDAFVAKLDRSGNFTWVSQIGGTSIDATWGVAVDASGNVYATGRFTGTASISLNGGAAVLTLTPVGGSGEDAFVAKLDSAGNPLWAKNLGSSGSDDWGFGISADPNGNVYATGRFSGTASFGSLTPLVSKGGLNAYVTRLDSSGNFQWAQRMGGETINTNGTTGYGIALETRSSDPSTWAVYVTGSMNGNSCDFGSTTFSTGGDDSFVTKLDATTGSFTWADQLGGAGQEVGRAIALDGAGNVYTSGGFGANSQPANFDPHGTFIMYPGNGTYSSPGNDVPAGNYREAYLSMLDANGNFLAAWQSTAQASDGNQALGITADGAGDVWISGQFGAVTTFPNGQTLTPNPAASNGLFLIRVNAPHGAVVGTVWDDLNNSGTRDGEPPLVGRTVYADLNNNGVLDPGEPSAVTDIHGNYEINGLAPGTYTIRTVTPAGWTTTTPAGGAYTVAVGNGFARNNDFGEYTPTTRTTYTQTKATAIKGRATVQSTLSVSDSYSLLDLDINVNISYSPDGRLSLYLIAPDGTTVPLWIGNGASGSNFTNTTFDDEASTSISSGSAPFTGSYQPLQLLAALQGKSVKGTWTLQVGNGSISTGKINSWSLIVTHATSSLQLPVGGVAPGGVAVASAPMPTGLAPITSALTAQQWGRLERARYLTAADELSLTSLHTFALARLSHAAALDALFAGDGLLADQGDGTLPDLLAGARRVSDTDFKGVRGAEALAKLPQAERSDWQRLWEEVAALRQRAAGLKK